MNTNENIVVLTSPNPFIRLGANFLFFIVLFIISLATFGTGNMLFSPDSFMNTACMIIGVIIFLIALTLSIISYKVIIKHMAVLSGTKFKLTSYANLENVYARIVPALKIFYGDKINLSQKNDHILVTCNGIDYKICLKDNATFSVTAQKSLFDKFLTLVDSLAENFADYQAAAPSMPVWKYDRVRTEIPRIAFTLQRAFGVTASEIDGNVQEDFEKFYEQEEEVDGNLNAAESNSENSNASQNRSQNISSGTSGKFAQNKKILAALIAAAGLILIVAVGSNGSTDKESILNAYKLVGGYWESDDGHTLNISTLDVNDTPYKITSVSENSDATVIEFETSANKGIISVKKNDITQMEFKSSRDDQGVSYYLKNSPYKRNLEGDLNLIFIYGHMGSAVYLDLNSIKVDKNENGDISLVENAIGVNADKNYKHTKTYNLAYRVINGIPYSVHEQGLNFLDVNDLTGVNSFSRNAFLTGFFYAFGYNFNYTPQDESSDGTAGNSKTTEENFKNPRQIPEYYVGTYPESGLNAYILSSSVKLAKDRQSFFVTVRAKEDSKAANPLIVDVEYHFWRDRDTIYFSNSQGYSGAVTDSMPVEHTIWTLVQTIF